MQKTNEESASISLGALYACAERELAAFAGAVQALFGQEQARQAIEDWMEELESMDWRGQGPVRDWRNLTIAAASRLANRVSCRPPAAAHLLP